jgi:hypothetical protein
MIPLEKEKNNKKHLILVNSLDFDKKVGEIKKKWKIEKIIKSLAGKNSRKWLSTEDITENKEFREDVKKLLSPNLGKDYFDLVVKHIFDGVIDSYENKAQLMIEIKEKIVPKFYLQIFPDTNAKEIGKMLKVAKEKIKRLTPITRKSSEYFEKDIFKKSESKSQGFTYKQIQKDSDIKESLDNIKTSVYRHRKRIKKQLSNI